MSSSVITIGGFLPGNKTAPTTKSADLIAFVADSLPLTKVVIFSPYWFFKSFKISSFMSIAVTDAPIWIDLWIELLPTSPQPMTVTFEFFSCLRSEDSNKAKEYFNYLINNHPDSGAGILAAEELKKFQ